MNIHLIPKEILKLNVYLILLLLGANILGIISSYIFNINSLELTSGLNLVDDFIKLFDFNTERNIPTLYSSIALIGASILLIAIAFKNKTMSFSYIPWLILSFIFLFLSIDEISSIHERLVEPTKEIFGTSGLLYYAWVIPYGIAVILFVIAYSKFLFRLPKNIMILFIVSGTTFISGAIGFEMLGGRHVELYGRDNILHSFFYTCEELLEMLGVAIFIYTLLTHIIYEFEALTVTIKAKTKLSN